MAPYTPISSCCSPYTGTGTATATYINASSNIIYPSSCWGEKSTNSWDDGYIKNYNKYVKWGSIIYNNDLETNSNYICKDIYSKKICNYIDTTTAGSSWKIYDPVTTGTGSIYWPTVAPLPLTPSERMRELLRARRGPAILGTRTPLSLQAEEREQRARETLRSLVGEDQFRRFLKHGFITVKAKSGLTYQLFHHHTYTWQNGKRLQHLCVVLAGNFPPTDTLIVRYLMILNNEQQFRQLAIASSGESYVVPMKPKTVDMRPLMEVFQELKAAA
ncbi:MAG: hypothetical protein M0R80_07960 [Proteobacteria bacterium]|jgi:hypothetical protein|nr:hypothetical protein [Pseudomonadota bacterium]